MTLEDEVKQLIGQPQGISLEVNPILPGSVELAEIISGFANTEEGYIILGVTITGFVEGLPPEMNVQKVINKTFRHLTPQPQIFHQFVTVEGKQVYVIKVLKSSKEVLVKGQIFMREGRKTVVKPSLSINNLPDFFVEDLKKQVTKQYQIILRYRDLKNNASDKLERQKYQEEIELRQQNIEEIKSEFLNNVKIQGIGLSENDLLNFTLQTVSQVKQAVEQQAMDFAQATLVSNNKPVIFTAFANPDDNLKNLSREYKEIQKILAPLEAKKHIAKHYSLQDIILKEYFNFLHDWENQLTIFHFGGHAGSLAIGLQDGDMSFEHLAAELLRCNPNSLQLVFLNGCATEAHVQHLFELGAKAVIATATKVYDKQASSFAITFYEYLAKGDTIAKAFDSAANFVQSPNGSAQRFSQGSRPIRWSEDMNHQGKFPWGLYINDDEVGGYRLVDSIF